MPVKLIDREKIIARLKHGDLEFVPDEEGIIEVPDGVDYSSFLDHGFEPCSEGDLVPLRRSAHKEIAEANQSAKEKHDAAVRRGIQYYGQKEVPVIPDTSDESGDLASEDAEQESTQEKTSSNKKKRSRSA